MSKPIKSLNIYKAVVTKFKARDGIMETEYSFTKNNKCITKRTEDITELHWFYEPIKFGYVLDIEYYDDSTEYRLYLSNPVLIAAIKSRLKAL